MDVRNEGREGVASVGPRFVGKRMIVRLSSNIVDRSDGGVTCSGKSHALPRASYALWGGEGGIEGKSEKGGIL